MFITVNTSHSSSFHMKERIALRRQNAALAASLNEAKLENAALCQRINDLNGELLDVRQQMAEYKRQQEEKDQADSHAISPPG